MCVVSGLCDACYSSRVQQELKESLRYDRAKLFIRLVSSTNAAEESEWVLPAVSYIAYCIAGYN